MTSLCMAALLIAPAGAASDAAVPPAQVAAAAHERERAGAESPDRAALEQRLAKTLTGAVLEGTWRVTQRDEEGGATKLSDPRPDRYTIVHAEKDDGDRWIITARIEYGGHDVTLPVRLEILWAGDTPVITVNNVGLPGLGTYSARVLIHGAFYAGTWSGGDHGGVLSGRITRAADDAPADDASRPADDARGPGR